jgi:hypothetical protein
VNFVTQNLVAPFGCPQAYYFNSLRFSNAVEQYGVIPTGIECLPLARKGFRLALCSGEHEYEVLLDNSWVKLRLIRIDRQQVPLAEGGAASQAVWDRFIQVIKQIEDK